MTTFTQNPPTESDSITTQGDGDHTTEPGSPEAVLPEALAPPEPIAHSSSSAHLPVCVMCGGEQPMTGQKPQPLSQTIRLATADFWDLATTNLVRCTECGHAWLHPSLPPEVVEKGCLALYRMQMAGETDRSRRRGFLRSFRKGAAFGTHLWLRGLFRKTQNPRPASESQGTSEKAPPNHPELVRGRT